MAVGEQRRVHATSDMATADIARPNHATIPADEAREDLVAVTHRCRGVTSRAPGPIRSWQRPAKKLDSAHCYGYMEKPSDDAEQLFLVAREHI